MCRHTIRTSPDGQPCPTWANRAKRTFTVPLLSVHYRPHSTYSRPEPDLAASSFHRAALLILGSATGGKRAHRQGLPLATNGATSSPCK